MRCLGPISDVNCVAWKKLKQALWSKWIEERARIDYANHTRSCILSRIRQPLPDARNNLLTLLSI